ncbi:MAG: hypothetical protein R3331_05535 [Sulfurospirillaceae bacterium]|nr:hypothetical protein [Sulfurospirillaceae bacterium]
MRIFLLFFIALHLWGFDSDIGKLKDYKAINIDFVQDKTPYIAIRSWKQNNQNYYLVLNESLMITKIIKVLPRPKQIKDTAFDKIKKSLLSEPSKLHNFGITTPENSKLYLTIDMCPSSKKGYEKKLFLFLKRSNSVANISISGKWMLGHKRDFDELLQSGLRIRWINHSFSHYYDRKQKNWSKNFMLKNPDAFDSEIMKTEKLLIINHQTPSVFFRFPGLVSDKNLVDRLIMTYNLLPLGTNNWLNVNRKLIQKSQIILVHGNLNEHHGIVLFFDQNQSGKHILRLKIFLLDKI